MDMNDILKSIGQKQSQEKKKAAPRVQMIHYTKLKPSPDNFYDTEGIEKLAAAIRIAGEIKNPLRVRKTDIDEYEVNEGHRRRLATIYNVEQLGIKEFEFVPCVVEDTTNTIGKLNLILSNSTQRERTEYEKMQETAKLRILLEQYAKENETKIPSTDMRKMISTILGVTGILWMKQKNSLRMEVCQYLLQMKWQDYRKRYREIYQSRKILNYRR